MRSVGPAQDTEHSFTFVTTLALTEFITLPLSFPLSLRGGVVLFFIHRKKGLEPIACSFLQPSYQNKCWQSPFLQITDMLKHEISLCSNFMFP